MVRSFPMRQRVLALAVLVAACGPSFQTIYENDARFEHCYALEEGSASLTQKATCWRDWKEHHTLGQTRDRVDYAMSRYVALNSNALPTDEGMMQAAPGEVGERTQNTAPAPTNPFAPPEATMNEDAGNRAQQTTTTIPMASAAATQTADDGASLRPPGAACTEECARVWDSCKHGRDTKPCDGVYDRCVVGCVKH
jgi:hypothetical protein